MAFPSCLLCSSLSCFFPYTYSFAIALSLVLVYDTIFVVMQLNHKRPKINCARSNRRFLFGTDRHPIHFVSQDVIILNTIFQKAQRIVTVEFCVFMPGNYIRFVPPEVLQMAMLHEPLESLNFLVNKEENRQKAGPVFLACCQLG